MRNQLKKPFAVLTSITALGALVAGGSMNAFASSSSVKSTSKSPTTANTEVITGAKANTPIQHVVVIFDENESFDHYFGTYPIAKNPAGEPPFYAAPGTPKVNGLTKSLLTHNPNAANPQRLDRSQAMTPDMDHGFTSEQKSFDGGLMDKFVQNNGHGNPMVMDYYDGNTVTAFWNFAQHFAMNDNYFGSNLGPSTPGAINVISGNTSGATAYSANKAQNGKQLQPGDKGYPSEAVANGTLYGDIDPYYDAASKDSTAGMSGTNIGDLLNKKGLTWGSFFGGYDDPTAQHKNVGGNLVTDYIPHHEPFEYYAGTSNVNHTKPSSVAMIGHTDQANHNYDLTDFWAAADAGNLPNYSFLKAPAYEDGHPSYSDPIDEQRWLVETVNKLESLPTWKNTAIIITYDDSDGWYDHVMPPTVNPSANGVKGNNATNPPQDRIGYGPRLPMVVISPYAKHNAVVHTLADQSSVLRFVEDNWNLGRIGNGSFDAKAGSLDDMFDFSPGYYNPPVFLDPNTGEPVAKITPFSQHGQLYMAVKDLEQSLDVQAQRKGNKESFMYGSHSVEIPFHGDTVTVDKKRVKLGAPIVNKSGSVCLPIANLAKALGVTPVQYKTNEILFKPSDAAGTTTPVSGTVTHSTGSTVSGSAAVTRFTIGNDSTTGSNTLSIGTPTSVSSYKGSGTIVNQTIQGARSGQTYHLVISATDTKGKPVDAGGTVYVTFTHGTIDKTGTLTSGETNISTKPVAVTLDSNGKAVLTYTVGTAPTNYDAYDNDEITISDSNGTSAASYTNEISVVS